MKGNRITQTNDERASKIRNNNEIEKSKSQKLLIYICFIDLILSNQSDPNSNPNSDIISDHNATITLTLLNTSKIEIHTGRGVIFHTVTVL